MTTYSTIRKYTVTGHYVHPSNTKRTAHTRTDSYPLTLGISDTIPGDYNAIDISNYPRAFELTFGPETSHRVTFDATACTHLTTLVDPTEERNSLTLPGHTHYYSTKLDTIDKFTGPIHLTSTTIGTKTSPGIALTISDALDTENMQAELTPKQTQDLIDAITELNPDINTFTIPDPAAIPPTGNHDPLLTTPSNPHTDE